MQTLCRLDVDQHGDANDVGDVNKEEWALCRHTKCLLDIGQHFDIDNIDDVNRILVNAANTCTIITQCRIDVGDDTIDKKRALDTPPIRSPPHLVNFLSTTLFSSPHSQYFENGI